ncbi:glutathione peroxidase [Oceanihabitans sp. 2_MG-2023]|uniref:glutathione peroxidase n=1 Tax=Oceanihabitans sp. 2_MG-2023 TaxID=3062661 RepID=UPI0026E1EF89|nr:glutathione peroxidase [Oceanihabitans sp. 2_MG-2023]MDO6596959.1 glutathione peroxidase [Oceanihabitans sp. 2_MG-2023]
MFNFFNKIKAQNTPSTSIYNIEINSLEGNAIDLSEYKDKMLLIVNVASECGFTKQYSDLQKLYDEYQDTLMIIGVPCNQFGNQESGTASEIQSFCKKNFGVTFLMTEKIDVKGSSQHPLYKWLTQKELNGKSNSSVKWNFQKYLINKKGQLVDSYFSTTNPTSNKIVKHLNP